MDLPRKQQWQNTWSTIVSILSESHQDPSATETFFWMCYYPLWCNKKKKLKLFSILCAICKQCLAVKLVWLPLQTGVWVYTWSIIRIMGGENIWIDETLLCCITVCIMLTSSTLLVSQVNHYTHVVWRYTVANNSVTRNTSQVKIIPM